MAMLIMFRHGQSVWNLENKFTGWVNVDLTEKGREEAKQAGDKLKGMHFDFAYSSDLKRAQETLQIALDEAGIKNVPTFYNEALNERMYGDLQGLNKAETAKKFGEEQVHQWRRSYDIPPPNGESLKDTSERVIPYFEQEIVPKLKLGKNVVIAAHGNSLRSLVMFLEKMSPEKIVNFEISTGIPREYDLDENLNIIKVQNL